jgi:hypothetical protein
LIPDLHATSTEPVSPKSDIGRNYFPQISRGKASKSIS